MPAYHACRTCGARLAVTRVTIDGSSQDYTACPRCDRILALGPRPACGEPCAPMRQLIEENARLRAVVAARA